MTGYSYYELTKKNT